ncbi:MAG: DUF4974 domain-containing protein [Balneolaceae bacterium]|nr:MAG: DUF4974 domain-containing protein [Balneolaceae bacterium]
MTDRYRKKEKKRTLSNSHSHAREPLPGDLKESERSDMERIWEASADTAFRHEHPDAQQTGDALESVHQRLGFSEGDAAKPRFLHRLPVYIAAAAVALLAFGLGFLLYPQSVTAPYGQRAAAVLPDGSTLELNSGTTIQYNRLFGIRNREIRLDGEAFFSVAPGDKPFIVSANRAVVEVTGTAFNVRSRSDDPGFETRVHVASGSVALYPAGQSDRSVTLSAGDWSRWSITMETPRTTEPAAPEHIGEWRENRFHFRNETLGMIFREVERRFDIRIQLEADQAASEVLTAHYTDPGDAERIIEDICHVKGLRYARTANGFRIYR